MNILFLAHRLPFPPNKGDKLRAFRHLKHLASSHRVWCACFLDDPRDRLSVEPLSSYCHELAAVPLSRTRAAIGGLWRFALGGTLTEGAYDQPAMWNVVKEWISSVRFDLVWTFSSSMAPYALTVPSDRRTLDLCDVDSAKWLGYAAAARSPLRWAFGAEGRRLRKLEIRWCHAFDSVVVISEAEAALVRPKVDSGRIHVISNGVDLPIYPLADSGGKPDRTANAATFPAPSKLSRPVVGFIGAMDYRPNVDAVTWFVETCWDSIRTCVPGVEFRIIGRNPTRRVRRLGRRAGVVVVGEVPLITSEVEKIRVSVAPMRLGRGLQNKVLEAMAHARPVVLTPLAAQGIEFTPGVHALVASNPADFAESVCRLLLDGELADRVGLAGRDYVAQFHPWTQQLARVDHLLGHRPVGAIADASDPSDRIEWDAAVSRKTAGKEVSLV